MGAPKGVPSGSVKRIMTLLIVSLCSTSISVAMDDLTSSNCEIQKRENKGILSVLPAKLERSTLRVLGFRVVQWEIFIYITF